MDGAQGGKKDGSKTEFTCLWRCLGLEVLIKTRVSLDKNKSCGEPERPGRVSEEVKS